MLDILGFFGTKKYEPLNKIEIIKENLLRNYQYISSLNHNISISPVLKSNAYGHGLIQIATILDSLNCPFFCVDSLYEAYALLKAEVKTRILVMGYIDPNNLSFKKLPFSYVIWDLDQALKIAKYQRGAGIHIFVDTGMNREGVKLDDLEELLLALKKIKGINIEGLMSHLAVYSKKSSAYTKNESYPKFQLQNYQKALKICKKIGINPKWKHLAASGGLLNKYTKKTNMSRCGISLYGIDREDRSNGKLKPILSLKTKIIQIKDIKKGDKVGYDSTFQAKKDMTIGVLPLGYNDGIDRRLSNKGCVLVGGSKCPIIGRISMNITTIDLTGIKRFFLGQEALVFSSNPKDPNSIQNAAKICKTLPHDLLVHINPTFRREIV